MPSSLPSRERGLKSRTQTEQERGHGSLPSRERGLKCMENILRGSGMESLPSRERGLKLYSVLPSRWIPGRSPRGSVD